MKKVQAIMTEQEANDYAVAKETEAVVTKQAID
jgi:hypothetical protein